MKKLLLIIIYLATFTNVSYTSFPLSNVETIYDLSDSPIYKPHPPR
mgnify:CR=1 FL=1